jgi:hypothetical protein
MGQVNIANWIYTPPFGGVNGSTAGLQSPL